MTLQLLLTGSLVLLTGCYIETHHYDAQAQTQPPSTEYLSVQKPAMGDLHYSAPVAYDLLGCQSTLGPNEQLPYIDLQESQQFTDFQSYDSTPKLSHFNAQLTQINHRLAEVEELAFQLCDPGLDSISTCAAHTFSQGQFDYSVDNAYATEQIFSYDIRQLDRLSGESQIISHIRFYDIYKANGRYEYYTPYGLDTLSWSKDNFGDSQIVFSNDREYTVAHEQANCTGEITTEQYYASSTEQIHSQWWYEQQQLQLALVSGEQCLTNLHSQCQYQYY